MDFALIICLLLLALGWFWMNSLHILELARIAGKQACINADVQFLDDTVARTGIVLARDDSGRRVLRRLYRFEFTETGNSRLEGHVLMLGDRLESVSMDPYRIMT